MKETGTRVEPDEGRPAVALYARALQPLERRVRIAAGRERLGDLGGGDLAVFLDHLAEKFVRRTRSPRATDQTGDPVSAAAKSAAAKGAGNGVRHELFGSTRNVIVGSCAGGAMLPLRRAMLVATGVDRHWYPQFRADEMGTAPIGAAYWKAVESGTDPETLKQRGPNPLWGLLSRALASPRRLAVYGDRQ